MGVWIGRGSRSRIPIVVQWGDFDLEAALRESGRAYAEGDLVEGEPRVFTPTATYRPGTALVSDLQGLQAHIAGIESSVRGPAGLTVIVVHDTPELPVAAVYSALWDRDTTNERRFRIVKSFAEAETLLDVPGLARDLEDVTRRGPHPFT